jgi:hypothetical protein
VKSARLRHHAVTARLLPVQVSPFQVSEQRLAVLELDWKYSFALMIEKDFKLLITV